MHRYLLDTDVLIDILKGHAPTVLAFQRLPPESATAYSVVSEAELYVGVPDLDGPEREALVTLLAAMESIPVDSAVARLAGQYRRRHGATAGTSLPDALIAASAHFGGAALVTRNRKHFPMDDVRVIAPEDIAHDSGTTAPPPH